MISFLILFLVFVHLNLDLAQNFKVNSESEDIFSFGKLGKEGVTLNWSYKSILKDSNVKLDETSKVFFCNCHFTAPFRQLLIIFVKCARVEASGVEQRYFFNNNASNSKQLIKSLNAYNQFLCPFFYDFINRTDIDGFTLKGGRIPPIQ